MADRQRIDRLERMTNLVLVLLETPVPLTLREISGSVAGYPSAPEAARQAFERDKRALRQLGIPLQVEAVSSGAQIGYRIPPDDYYLPELGLDESETQALGFAIAAVKLGGAAGMDAIAKLGGPVTEAAFARSELAAQGTGPAMAPVAVLPSLPALGPIHEALRHRAVLHFEYNGRPREVEPSGLALRSGIWYLVGRDRAALGGPATRTFRVDRIASSPALGEAGAFELPAPSDLRDEIRLLPWSAEGPGAEVPVAEVLVDARQARVVATQMPRSAIAGWQRDGGLKVRISVGDREAFVSWVLGLGDTAVVEGPAELRDAVVDRLSVLSGDQLAPAAGAGRAPAAGGGHAGAAAAERLERRHREEVPATLPSSPRAPRTGSRAGGQGRGTATSARAANAVMAGERLRRLLAILVHLARVGEAELAEVAARFSIEQSELIGELELAACCGVPPYSPDELIELFIDGDRVVAERLRELGRPQRLTADEGFVLAAAAKALLSVPGADDEGVLRSALAKLEAAIGSAPLAVEIEQSEHLRGLQEAARARESIEIEYYSGSATSPRRREVDPYQVVLREGRWYLDAWCHVAAGLRRFQVDRVRSVRGLGHGFEERADLSSELNRPGAFLGGPDAVVARVAFPAGAELVIEQFATGPVEEMSDGSGRLAATILVGDADGWFGRLLLRLGPGTEVLSPPQLRDAGVNAARRALSRYLAPLAVGGSGLQSESSQVT
ncbi:MAG: helix-turn-helix transcriptional regulator [Acidimicrobiales bacterium]